MKTNGNGGYQIIDFEGQAPNTLDVGLFGNAIARGKPLWVNNLVVDGETYCGVASAKKTLTHIILVLATIQIVIALSDGSTTYVGVDDFDIELDITLDASLSYTGTSEEIKNVVLKTQSNPQPLKAKIHMVSQDNDEYNFIGILNIDALDEYGVHSSTLFYEEIGDALKYLNIRLENSNSNNVSISILAI